MENYWFINVYLFNLGVGYETMFFIYFLGLFRYKIKLSMNNILSFPKIIQAIFISSFVDRTQFQEWFLLPTFVEYFPQNTLQKLWQYSPSWLGVFRRTHLGLSTIGNIFERDWSWWTQSPWTHFRWWTVETNGDVYSGE